MAEREIGDVAALCNDTVLPFLHEHWVHDEGQTF
jgi:hypothetical protein